MVAFVIPKELGSDVGRAFFNGNAAKPEIALVTGCALAFGALAVMRFRWEADG